MKILSLILILMLYANNLCAQNIEKRCDLVCWSENYKLRWGDFQAKKNPVSANDSFSNINAANAAPEITVNPILDANGGKSFVVNVVFDRKRAWVRDSSLSTNDMLEHEQLHFDISELVGRIIRASIGKAIEKNVDIYSKAFGVEIMNLLNQQNVINTLYDRETEHGTIIIEQKKWSAYVRKELQKLYAYKSIPFKCL